MKNWWIKLGCFLTGYNYSIVMNSGEVTAMKVKQNMSALLIVCLLWSFVGYSFTQRYVKADMLGSIAGGVLACIVVIQIERQIILSITSNKFLYFMRFVIAFLMAIIGSIIIDQILFKADIEKQQISNIDKEVNKVYPAKSEELRLLAKSLDSTLLAKETYRSMLSDDLSRHPMVKIYTGSTAPIPITTQTTDSARNVSVKTKVVMRTTTSVSSIQNPKISMLAPLDAQIAEIRNQKMQRDNAILTLRGSIEQEIKSKVGFLDELKVMCSLLMESGVALGVWLIWFFILLGLELFIVAAKGGENMNVYDETIRHQQKLQKKKLALLSDLG
jgi:hypothetical protein